MKAYAVSIVKEMKDEAMYQEEVTAVRKSVTDGGGKFIVTAGVGGGQARGTIVPGDKEEAPPARVVIAEFPDMETATDWWDNGGEEEVDNLKDHADLTIFFVEALN